MFKKTTLGWFQYMCCYAPGLDFRLPLRGQANEDEVMMSGIAGIAGTMAGDRSGFIVGETPGTSEMNI